MQQNLAIWCPVVITNLRSPRLLRQENKYQLAESYKRIEDLKVRIKTSQSQIRGKFVETKVGVAWICLLENSQGRLNSLRHEEVLIDRVSLQYFKQLTEYNDELRYIQDINSFSWDAELKDGLLIIKYELSYMLMGTKERLVLVETGNEQVNICANISPNTVPADGQADERMQENFNLRRQLHFYEVNLSSLKKGIQKAEMDKYALNTELKNYKNTVEELRDAIVDKDRIINSFVNRIPRESDAPKSWTVYEPNKLGQRIKKIFIDNL